MWNAFQRLSRRSTVATTMSGEGGLKNAAGGATTKIQSVCICETDLCITLQYSNCNLNTCNCS